MHSSGSALDMFYAVAESAKAVVMYIGYVTPKKISGALSIAPGAPVAADDRFKQTTSGFKPKLH